MTELTPLRWKAIRAVLAAIQAHPNEHPSEAQLAKATGKSVRAVRYALRWAEEAELLKTSISHGRGLANCYFIPDGALRKPATKTGNVAALHRGTSYPYSNRRLRRSSSGTTPPPPGGGGRPEAPTPQPPWSESYRGNFERWWNVPLWADWRPNGKAQKCEACHVPVEPEKGWMTPRPSGRGWLVVHEVCPRFMEGRRSGEPVRTAGDIQVDNNKFRHH